MWPSIQLLYNSILGTLISILLTTNTKQNKIDSNGYTSAIITPEERIAIDEFRSMVSDLALDDFERTAHSLLRWLRAASFKLDRANNMLRESMQWRKDVNWDTILDETPLHFKQAICSADGRDKKGNIILTADLAQEDIRRWVIKGNKEKFTRTLFQCAARSFERLKEVWKETGKDDIGVFAIADVGGYNIKQHGCFSCIGTYKEFATLYEKIFPGIVKMAVALNGPTIVKPLVNLLTPMVSSINADAIHIFGSDKKEWQAFLLRYVSPDQLAKRYGGTRELATLYT